MEISSLNEVTFDITRSSKSKKNTFLTLIEQFLACNFSDYHVILTESSYNTTNVKIVFQNIEDATFFRLRINYVDLQE